MCPFTQRVTGVWDERGDGRGGEGVEVGGTGRVGREGVRGTTGGELLDPVGALGGGIVVPGPLGAGYG